MGWSCHLCGVELRLPGDDDYDIYIVGTSGFDLDDLDKPVQPPVNLTGNDDRDDMTPSWRPY